MKLAERRVAPAFGLVRVLKHGIAHGGQLGSLVAPAFGLVRVLKLDDGHAARPPGVVAPAFGLVRVLKLVGRIGVHGRDQSHRPSGWCVC